MESGARVGYRHRVRLAVRGRVGSPKIGLFEAGSHRVVHIPDCRIQHPLINRVAAVVREALIDAQVTAYSEQAHAGLVRYLQVAIERRSQSAQVVLVANCADAAALTQSLNLIRIRLGSALHSLWLNLNQEQTNRILGTAFLHWHGPRAIVDRFGGAEIHYPPGAFGQSNPEIAARIIDHVREQVTAGARAVELYAGVGAIGLSRIDRVAALRLNKLAPQSLLGLEMTIAGLDPMQRAKVSIAPGPASAARGLIQDAEVVIADPPRKGLDPTLMQEIIAQPPHRLIYVSCGLDSLLRDVALLTSGGLKLDSLRAFNLIPYTAHVETVACFSRA